MAEQESIAVIGAGVIGSAIACALAREGRRVLLIDKAAPGEGGASFGNAGHITTELLAPLPAPSLLFGFWRELFALGGVLDIPARRLATFAPWAARFARAAFQRAENTAHLAPFVRPAVPALVRMLRAPGCDGACVYPPLICRIPSGGHDRLASCVTARKVPAHRSAPQGTGAGVRNRSARSAGLLPGGLRNRR